MINEMLIAHDWYRTFAALAGASDKVPTDRPLDGVDASPFLLGKLPTTGRKSVLFVGPNREAWSVKRRTMKTIFAYSDGMEKAVTKPRLPMLFDLEGDPREEYNPSPGQAGRSVFGIALGLVEHYEKSIERYPNIKPGEEFTGYATAPAHAGAAPQRRWG